MDEAPATPVSHEQARSHSMEKRIILQEVQRLTDQVAACKADMERVRAEFAAQSVSAEEVWVWIWNRSVQCANTAALVQQRLKDTERAMDAVLMENERLKQTLSSSSTDSIVAEIRSHHAAVRDSCFVLLSFRRRATDPDVCRLSASWKTSRRSPRRLRPKPCASATP
jgi:hypothetical protein